MFKGIVWNLGILCSLLSSQNAIVAQENDLFGEVSKPEQTSDDPFAEAPIQESTSQEDEQKAEPFPANLKLVIGSGQRVVEGGVTSSRGLVTLPPATRQASERIDAVLDQPLKIPLDYVEIPLNQIVQAIADDYNLPIVLDLQAFDILAISKEFEITVNLRNLSLRAALDLMLRQTEDLTYLVDGEVLLITTKEEARERLEVRVYRVDDLIRVPGTGELDFDSLIDALISTVEMESWMENGTGSAEVHPYLPGMLVVAQTRRAHQQIEALFSTMREVKTAIETNSPVIAEEPSTAVHTKAFRIQNVWGDDPEQGREVLHEAIVISVAWEQEDVDEDDTLLAVLPDRVIARHTPSILKQVEQTLKDLGYIRTHGSGPSIGGSSPSAGSGFFQVEDATQK